MARSGHRVWVHLAVALLLVCGVCSATAAAERDQLVADGALPVATRSFPFADPARTTDPTPGRPGDETAGRPLPTRIWYPTTGGPYPVVLFSHGVGGKPGLYDALLSGWAAAGFVVAAPTFPVTSTTSSEAVGDIANQPADVSFVLTRVLALAHDDGPLSGRIDAGRIAAAGHSGGAVTTLGLLDTCCADPRLDAAIVMAGTLRLFGDTYASPGVPTLFVHGSADDVVPLADGQAAFAAAPEPKAEMILRDGSHATPFQDAADAAFPTVLATSTDFLRWALSGAPDALHDLRADADKSRLVELSDDLPR